MKSQPSIKYESKPGNSASQRNYQNLLTVDKNSKTETNKNISSERCHHKATIT